MAYHVNYGQDKVGDGAFLGYSFALGYFVMLGRNSKGL